MRYDKDLFELVDSGNLTGSNRACGRVTVEADWQLGKTSTGGLWGNSIRGPYRWFQNIDNDQTEMEIPNIKSIQIDRQLSQDIASCTISIYNQWHHELGADGATPAVDNIPADTDQLGKPGYFWPGHGTTADAQTNWGQTPSTGAVDKDGVSNPSFNWAQALVPYGLLRTYQGYGGHGLSVQGALDAKNIFQTGVWLIETVTAGTDGMLTLACKDIGKLLIDQLVMPPLIPNALYPLEYVPDGESRFDSYWEPNPRTGVSPASQGRVPFNYYDSSSWLNTSASLDRKDSTYAYSPGHNSPDDGSEWIQFITKSGVATEIDQVELRTWAGGYNCYLSIWNGSSWEGSTNIPGETYPYVSKITIPLAIPDGNEREYNISVPGNGMNCLIYRLTFQNYYYGNLGSPPYRVGVRESIAYIKNSHASTSTSGVSPDDPWTHAMCPHPTRGYWVADQWSNVYAFGDAEVEPLTSAAAPDTYNGHPNFCIGMTAHPDGKGYWILKRSGHVESYGSATLEADGSGNVNAVGYINDRGGIGADNWGAEGWQAFDIAATYDGNGYYIVIGDGRVLAFGNAISTSGFSQTIIYNHVWNQYMRPVTSVDNFMQTIPIQILVPANNPLGFERAEVHTYYSCRRGTSVDAHPSALGCWVTSGSGEVSALGASANYGQLVNRVYNPSSATSFRLTQTEFTHSIRSTETGNGYWILFGSGHIAAFGDAVGQGPTSVYETNPALDLQVPTSDIHTWEFFRALTWSMAVDPDGSGFWLLAADGSVGHYDAKFWGQPGFYGMSGIRWFEGNYEDYVDIVKDVLLWSGWLLYDSGQSGSAAPPVYGSLESTGIPSDAKFEADKFDKKTIIDVINEIKQIVGYSFWIDWDGSAIFTSPNWWQAGNVDNSDSIYTGTRLYVSSVTGLQVPSTDPNAELFIPEISEQDTLTDYQVQLSGDALRSEIIVGSNQPDYKDPTSTGFVRYYPTSATNDIRTGVPALRNIVKPAMWVNEAFENEEELQLMAELINLQIWFSQRTGNVQTVGNPLININDQVTVKERNTSETFLHYVRGVSSSMDLDTGEYTMTLTTNWLGDSSDWVITTGSTSDADKIQISNRADRWQSNLGLGLASSLGSSNPEVSFNSSGGFESITVPFDNGGDLEYATQWTFIGTIVTGFDIDDFTISSAQFSENLGSAQMEIVGVETFTLPIAGETYSLTDNSGTLAAGSYTYTITGTPTEVGNGVLSLKFDGSNALPNTVIDSTVIVATPQSVDSTATSITWDWEVGSATASAEQDENVYLIGYTEPDVLGETIDFPVLYVAYGASTSMFVSQTAYWYEELGTSNPAEIYGPDVEINPPLTATEVIVSPQAVEPQSVFGDIPLIDGPEHVILSESPIDWSPATYQYGRYMMTKNESYSSAWTFATNSSMVGGSHEDPSKRLSNQVGYPGSIPPMTRFGIGEFTQTTNYYEESFGGYFSTNQLRLVYVMDVKDGNHTPKVFKRDFNGVDYDSPQIDITNDIDIVTQTRDGRKQFIFGATDFTYNEFSPNLVTIGTGYFERFNDIEHGNNFVYDIMIEWDPTDLPSAGNTSHYIDGYWNIAFDGAVNASTPTETWHWGWADWRVRAEFARNATTTIDLDGMGVVETEAIGAAEYVAPYPVDPQPIQAGGSLIVGTPSLTQDSTETKIIKLQSSNQQNSSVYTGTSISSLIADENYIVGSGQLYDGWTIDGCVGYQEELLMVSGSPVNVTYSSTSTDATVESVEYYCKSFSPTYWVGEIPPGTDTGTETQFGSYLDDVYMLGATDLNPSLVGDGVPYHTYWDDGSFLACYTRVNLDLTDGVGESLQWVYYTDVFGDGFTAREFPNGHQVNYDIFLQISRTV